MEPDFVEKANRIKLQQLTIYFKSDIFNNETVANVIYWEFSLFGAEKWHYKEYFISG